MSKAPLSRRGFLRATAGVTVVFGAGCSALPVIPKRPRPSLKDATGWINYSGGQFTLVVPRVEMGQHIATALKQIACEELNVGWDGVSVALHDTARIRPVRASVGSESVKDFALPLAQACATLRKALERGIAQGEFASEEIPVTELQSLSGQRSALRYVGRSVELEQAEAIVTGAPLFAADVRRPGQLFGRVVRADASPELPSYATSLNEEAARAVPGYVALVRDPRLLLGSAEGIGIVARTPGALDRIERALAVRWRIEGSAEQGDVDRAIDIDDRGERLANRVHSDTIDTTAQWDVDLRIDVPIAAHAAIEPRAAVAEPDGTDGLRVWVGSQDVFYQRDVIAKRLGLSPTRVVALGCRVGGGFGGKTICQEALEAAVLARAVAAPVKVQWTRAQEFQQAFHRPPSSHRIRAQVRDGRLQTWWHRFASSHILFTNAVLPPWLQKVTDIIGDDGVARGAALPYRAQSRRTEFDVLRLPVFTGPWRGLGAGPNVFAIECAIDECARVARADPVAFRLAHAEDPRLARVVQRLAAATPPLPQSSPGMRAGRGVACGIYKGMSYAAVIADVEVDSQGAIRVRRMWCAHDCGRVINPDQVRAQCEGNLVWGIGMVLHESLRLRGGRVDARTFAESPIPRITDIPPMQVLLVDEDDPPTGAGETVIIASGAAIANAIRDATGWRATRLPVERVPTAAG